MEAWIYRLVSEKFSRLKGKDFAVKYEDEIEDLAEAQSVDHRTVDDADLGRAELWLMRNQLCVVYHLDSDRWSLFETEARAEERDYFAAWNEFTRGYWSENVPSEPGLYFCRDRDLKKRSVREIQRVRGRLVDVGGGFVPSGQVTVFRGQWYIPAIPKLKDSY